MIVIASMIITSHLPIDHALRAPALMRGLTAYRFVAKKEYNT